MSLMSDHGVKLEDIADLVGHSGTRTTEGVYRHQLRPVVRAGAGVMDSIFAASAGANAGAMGANTGANGQPHPASSSPA